jgi:hypothetical protein
MNYEKIYCQIIERSKVSCRKKLLKENENYIYYESHHIIPKCLGGSNKKENLVLLTSREHFLCHWLLIKIYPDSKKLAHAFYRMCCMNNTKRLNLDKYIPSSRMYQEAKDNWIPHLRIQMSNRVVSNVTKEKLRIANLGKKYIRSEEYKKKCSLSRLGKKHEMTPARLKYYESLKGRTPHNKGKKYGPLSDECKQKIKDSLSKKINPMKEPENVKRCIESRKRNKEIRIENGTYVQRVPWNKGKNEVEIDNKNS